MDRPGWRCGGPSPPGPALAEPMGMCCACPTPGTALRMEAPPCGWPVKSGSPRPRRPAPLTHSCPCVLLSAYDMPGSRDKRCVGTAGTSRQAFVFSASGSWGGKHISPRHGSWIAMEGKENVCPQPGEISRRDGGKGWLPFLGPLAWRCAHGLVWVGDGASRGAVRGGTSKRSLQSPLSPSVLPGAALPSPS